MEPEAYIQLADYRRQVFEMYARVRDTSLSPRTRWLNFRTDQDQLYKNHPQTALKPEQAATFQSLNYYPYDPGYRFVLSVTPLQNRNPIRINLQDDGPTYLLPFGQIAFTIDETPASLTLYWIQAYGGGIFLPFKDSTNSRDTYAGGRYLLDTVKGAYLGGEGLNLVIDFNFAYNPSCAYNSRWHCPLPQPENQLTIPIPVGEKVFEASENSTG